ncbi:hypothetical protein BIV57_00570 [Mangrovactinospora gilvigrisea]|uniref:Mobilization protein n=2 Tax=Mangrovactinospora gilvigrisea TaxID=1428644 RepID=A0A1J7BLI3_9ACTN|nr:hypothetical protein BIV57_00570 [Mangrovactinospora gilvigrisea]
MRIAEGGGETPEQKKQRARRLQHHATRARRLAASLGGYLDGEAKAAAERPAIWLGPYAEQTTAQLHGQAKTLRQMADALRADAARWDRAAEDLLHQAAADAKHPSRA